MNPFEELGISQPVIKALEGLGFESPTPIQEQAIPYLLQEKSDFVGLAQTGTGKTAAFGLPVIEKVDKDDFRPQALILSPTRELANQIATDLERFSKFMNLEIVAVYGGASIDGQIRRIRKGVQIVVATPGRLTDLINRRAIDMSTVKRVVLDEADEMLNMGFKDDIDFILSNTPDEKSTWLFSATMPYEVRRISKSYMTDPFELTVGKVNSGNLNIEHHYYVVNSRDKYYALKRLIDFYPHIFGIVFCRTKAETQEVAENLVRDGYDADALHGDLTQTHRDKVMKRYKDRSLQILVATDVAARGIDVDNVTHVINYNLPDDIESYTHRSGRTGRAGKQGTSIVLITSRDEFKIRRVEKIIHNKFAKKSLPAGTEVCQKQLMTVIEKVKEVEVSDELTQYLPQVEEALAEYSKEDIIKRFASLEFNKFLEYYKNAGDLNAGSRDDRRSVRGGVGETHSRFFINLGRVDGLNANSFPNFLAEASGLSARTIGDVDIKEVFSFFEIPNDQVEALQANFNDVTYNNRSVQIELANSKRGGGRRNGSGGGGYRKSGGDRNGGRNSGGYRKSGGDYRGGNDRGGSGSGSNRPRRDRRHS